MSDLKDDFQQLSSFAPHCYNSLLLFAFLTLLPGLGDPDPLGWVRERAPRYHTVTCISLLSLLNESKLF